MFLEGILILVSTTACYDFTKIDNVAGCYHSESHQIYVTPEYKDDLFVLYHEIGHYKYHKYFLDKNSFNFHSKFWLDVNKKMGYDYKDSPSWEIVANYYAWTKVMKQRMPFEVESYFNYF